MKNLSKTFFVAISLILFGLNLTAQNISDDIIKKIEEDSIITIYQSKKLADRLFVNSKKEIDEKSTVVRVETPENDNSGVNQKVAGFRIQVFSDNNARTAKNEARAKSKNITDAFPHLRSYVTYDAPYWRVRVGDFRSQSDAEEAAEEIKSQFPSYSREIRVVRDRINYSF